MPTITQLEYILALDQEKHFARAAEICHVSQPSLSAQIQKLEDELGIIIFDRSKKPIIPTEIGKDVIRQAELILKEHKKLGDIVSTQGMEPRGNFHLAVIPTLAPYLIPLFVGEFSRLYPRVNLKINEYKTHEIIDLLLKDQIDAGLLVTPLGHDQLIERHLFYEPFYVFVSENHVLSKKKQITELDLDKKDLWLLEEGHCFREQMLKVCSLNRKGSVLNNVEFASGNLETLKNLVKKSSGYTLLPDLATTELTPDDYKKFIRKFKNPIPTREISLVHSRSFLKEKIISALEEVIISELPRRIKSLKRQQLEVIDF